MKHLLKVYLSLFLLTLAVAALPGSVWANIAANTQITNSATLNYFSGATPLSATANVTVTVSLVPVAPSIVGYGPYTTQYVDASTTLTDTFTITAGSNGPDTYTLTPNLITDVNGTGASLAVVGGPTIILGASVTVAGSSATAIAVPSDGISDTSVNGIEVGDQVVINGEVHTVSGITDNATGTSFITLQSGLAPGNVPGAGILVEEQKTVYVTVTAGAITTPGTTLVVTDTLTATSATSPNPAFTSTPATVNNFLSGLATLAKYVRNVPPATDQHTVGATSISFNGNTYYSKIAGNAVAAKPGEVLEYLLIATNTGSGNVLSAVITDVVPSTYVAFKMNAYGASQEFMYWPDTSAPGASLTFSAASTNDDPAQYVASTLTVNVGGNPPPSLPLSGGTILTTKAVAVTYEVTVN